MRVDGENVIVHFPFCMNNGWQNVGSWRMPYDVSDTLSTQVNFQGSHEMCSADVWWCGTRVIPCRSEATSSG